MTPNLGKIVTLEIVDFTESGALLDNGGQDIFIHSRDLSGKPAIGDQMQVFIFKNKFDEPEATSFLPEISIGEAGVYYVTDTGPAGAYVNVGTKREILIPDREQTEKLRTGQKVVITLRVNKHTDQLFGSCRLGTHYRNVDIDLKAGEKVDLLVFDSIPIGRKVLINNKYTGILLDKEIFTALRYGDEVKGFVLEVKGKDIYLSTQPTGEERIQQAMDRIMEFLHSHKGYARLSDNSDPEEIKLRLKMSKKTFKAACGKLYKEQKINLTKRGIKLIKEGQVQKPKPGIEKPKPEVQKEKPKGQKPKSGGRRSKPGIDYKRES